LGVAEGIAHDAPATSIHILQASAQDLEAIARVLVDTWQSTFRGLLSDEFLEGMSYDHQ
jgi:hypothetical protein